MKVVVFGLSITSSWGNGHATLWRGLCRELHRLGHRVVFFEKDVPYYAAHRDFTPDGGTAVVLYSSWNDIVPRACAELANADVGLVTSYCPDALLATELVTGSDKLKVFYDLDTPVTLSRLSAGLDVTYIGPDGLSGFDLVLSFTGGPALEELGTNLGARRVTPLYGSVDPQVHRPAAPKSDYRCDLSYLGTYAADRQDRLERLFLEPARRRPEKSFVLGGSQYPDNLPELSNMRRYEHVMPGDHAAFYCSSNLTLNITRGAMAEYGYCPSGRLFEAAACGTAILSDSWAGLDRFFTPGREILIANTTEEAEDAIATPRRDLARIADAAFKRTLGEHTAECRAKQLERVLMGC
jgi:spore maturation protein CgeB